MKKRGIWVIIILSILISGGYVIYKLNQKMICTEDCRKMCDANSECCFYDGCVPSDCPGKDTKYYREQGFIEGTFDTTTYNWTDCDYPLPKP